jgi:hypothetical protein
MANEQKLGFGMGTLYGVCAVISVVEAVRIALGHTSDLRNIYVRSAVAFGFFFWAIVYQTWKEDERFSRAIAGLTLIASMGLIWYQLTKLGQTGWDKQDAVDRCAFLLGGIALMAKGMKDVFKEDEI